MAAGWWRSTCWGRFSGGKSSPIPTAVQVMRSQDPDGGRVVAQQLLGPRDQPLLYAKHMAK